jgi:hypothetical protein
MKLKFTRSQSKSSATESPNSIHFTHTQILILLQPIFLTSVDRSCLLSSLDSIKIKKSSEKAYEIQYSVTFRAGVESDVLCIIDGRGLGRTHRDIKVFIGLTIKAKRPRASHHFQTNIHFIKLLYFISVPTLPSLVSLVFPFFFIFFPWRTHKHCSSFSFMSKEDRRARRRRRRSTKLRDNDRINIFLN